MDLTQSFKEKSFFDKRVNIDIVAVTTATQIAEEFIKKAVIKERNKWTSKITVIGRIYIQKVNKLTDELVLEITDLERQAWDDTSTVNEIYKTIV